MASKWNPALVLYSPFVDACASLHYADPESEFSQWPHVLTKRGRRGPSIQNLQKISERNINLAKYAIWLIWTKRGDPLGFL